jgi:pimeloyl-ACP methyl ester carboxylesterase
MNFEGYKFTNYSTWMNMLTVNKLELLRALPDSSTLLIHGHEDPYFPSERTVTLYKSICPTLTSVAIERAGHLPHVEKPNEVFQVIDAFLN